MKGTSKINENKNQDLDERLHFACTYGLDKPLGSLTFYTCSCKNELIDGPHYICYKCVSRSHQSSDHSLEQIKKFPEYIKCKLKCECGVNYENKNQYYICLCNGEKFEPFCESCEKICHDKHKTFKIKGEYECKCGENFHHKNLYKYENEKNTCVYKIILVFCKENHQYLVAKHGIDQNQEECYYCENIECLPNNHYFTLNLAELFSYDIPKKKLYDKCLQTFMNFNLNLVFKISEFANSIPLINKSNDIFNDYKSYNSLNMIQQIHDKLNSPNILIKSDIFNMENLKEDYLNLLKKSENKNEFYFYPFIKFLYANVIFIFHFENYFKNYNLCKFRITEVVNMNSFQRNLYLSNFKNFYLFIEKRPEEIKNAKKIIDDIEIFSNLLMDNIDEYLIPDEKKSIDILITHENSYKIITKIIKWLCKRNFIKDIERLSIIVKNIMPVVLQITHREYDVGYNLGKAIFYLLLHNIDQKLLLVVDLSEKAKLNLDDKGNVYVNLLNSLANLMHWRSEISPTDRFGHWYNDEMKYFFFYTKVCDVLVNENEFIAKNIYNLKCLSTYQLKILSNFRQNKFSDLITHLTSEEKSDNLLITFRDKLNSISKSLICANNNFFSYSKEFTYINELNPVLKQIRDFMNENFESIIVLNKKYLTIKLSDIGNEYNQKKIITLREAVKYTNFFQALDGCFTIIAKIKEIDNNQFPPFKFNDIKENMTAIIYFLYTIIHDDVQNMILIFSIFNHENFINCLIDCDEFLDLFLEGVMDSIFGIVPKLDQKEIYKFDNYKFYSNIILFLMKKSKINIGNWFRYFTLALKLSIKPLKFLKCGEFYLFNMIENLLDFSFDKFMSAKIDGIRFDYFKSEKKLKELKEFKVHYAFIKYYISFWNGLMNSEFMYFIGDEYCMNTEDIGFFGDVLTKKNIDEYLFKRMLDSFKLIEDHRNLPLILRLKMTEFENNINFIFKSKRTSCNILWRHSKKPENGEKSNSHKKKDFDENLDENCENNYKSNNENFETIKITDSKPKNLNWDYINYEELNLKIPYLLGDIEVFNNNPNDDNTEIIKTTDLENVYLDSLNIKTDDYIKNSLKTIPTIFEDSYEIQPILRRKIYLHEHFEFSLVRPCFIIINNYMCYGKKINGTHMNQIYKLTKEFLFACKYYYENINSKLVVKDDVVHINEYEKIKLDDLVNLTIRVVDENNRKSILQNIILQIDKLKGKIYTDTEDLIYMIVDILKLIIKPQFLGNKIEKEDDNNIENQQCDGFELHGKDEIKNKFVNLEINETYYQNINSISNELSYQLDTNKMIYKCIEYICSYIRPTNENFNPPKTINARKFLIAPKLLYSFQILLNFSKRDLNNFQINFNNYFNENLSQYNIRIIDFVRNLLRLGIYHSSIYEVKKTYELKNLNYENMVFSLGKTFIKLLQNLCEFNNNIIKQIMYLEVEAYPIPYNDQITLFQDENNEDAGKKQELMKEIQNEYAQYSRKFSIINYLILLLKMYLANSNFENNNCLQRMKEVTPISNVVELLSSIIDLLIEIIQGCEKQLFYHFACKGTKSFFSNFLQEVKILFESNDNHMITNDLKEIKYKSISLLEILVTEVLNNSEYDEYWISKEIQQYFSDEFLNKISELNLMEVYENYCKNVKKIENEEININKNLKELNEGEQNLKLYFTKEQVKNLIEKFKSSEMFEDQQFKLASKAYIIKLILPKINAQLENKFGVEEIDSLNSDWSDDNKLSDISKNDKVSGTMIFSKIVLNCEFLIKRSSENILADMGNSSKQTKTNFAYFVINPHCYYIVNERMKQFKKNVDITNQVSKLKGFINEIKLFYSEIKHKNIKFDDNEKINSSNEEINFSQMDKYNLIFSLLINLILLLTITNNNVKYTWYYFTVSFISILQIFFNFYYIYIYFECFYKYNVMTEKKRLGKNNNLSFLEKFDIYVTRSIFSNEVYLFYFNLLVSLFPLISTDFYVLYPILLFNLVKSVSSIQNMIDAFKMKFDQLFSMVAFLAVLIFFYAIIGFYFMSKDFEMQFGNNEIGNACSSLLSCFVLYFNFGIRSGGGIGDVTGIRPFSNSIWFWFKWITDMIFYITVILILMNMVNGIIISTFSQIREEKEKREKDEKDVCFICGRTRSEFEKLNKNFEFHTQKQHNEYNYIYYLLCILLTDKTELNTEQAYIYKCMENDKISFFPVEKTIYLEKKDQNDNEN